MGGYGALFSTIRRKLRRAKRRNALTGAGLFLLLTFVSGWFIGLDPQTGNLTFTLGGQSSLSGRTLNYTATAVGLPTVIGAPDQLAFVDDEQTSSSSDTSEPSNTATPAIPQNDGNVAGTTNQQESTTNADQTGENATTTTSRRITSQTNSEDTDTSTSRGAEQSSTTATSRLTTDSTAATSSSPLPPTTLFRTGREPQVGNDLDADEFNLIQFDDFNGTSLNTNLWRDTFFSNNGYTRGLTTSESSCYHDDQVWLAGGQLHLGARRATSAESEKCVNKDETTAEFVSGMVRGYNSDTKDSLFTIGEGQYVETEVNVLTHNGAPQNWISVRFTDFKTGGDSFSLLDGRGDQFCSWHVGSGSDKQGCSSLSGTITVGMAWEGNTLKVYRNNKFVTSHRIDSKISELTMTIGYRIPSNPTVAGYNAPTSTSTTSAQTFKVNYVDIYEVK